MATPAASPTGRNLRATGRVRLGIGPTRDLVLTEGTVVQVPAAREIPDQVGGCLCRQDRLDPRQLTSPYLYFWIASGRLQAWREANELAGRELMRDGHWLVAD